MLYGMFNVLWLSLTTVHAVIRPRQDLVLGKYLNRTAVAFNRLASEPGVGTLTCGGAMFPRSARFVRPLPIGNSQVPCHEV